MAALHVITGGTGLLGGALTLRLLQMHPDDRVLCLVRPGTCGPRTRLRAHLAACAISYGQWSIGPAIMWRVKAQAWEIDRPTDGLDLTGVDSVWHLAASRGDRQDDRACSRATDAVSALLSAAVAAGVRRFVYASTAFVKTPSPRNAYELAKWQGETLVLGERRIDGRVLRPATVMGHSRTHAAHASVYGGPYALATVGPCDGMTVPQEWTMNLVPVDVAVRQAVESSGPVTWLTGANTLPADVVAAAAIDPGAVPVPCGQIRERLVTACPYLGDHPPVPAGDGPAVSVDDVRLWRDWYIRNRLGGRGDAGFLPPTWI